MRPEVLAVPDGWRFAVSYDPSHDPVGGVLLVPPFAEELNRSRRQMSLIADVLVKRGWFVLQYDLFGTGDSSGNFEDARWEAWLDDLDRAWVELARALPESAPRSLVGIRAGCLLLSDWCRSRAHGAQLVLIQAPTSGRRVLGQFLRLAAISEILHESGERNVVKRLRTRLLEGNTVRVAGYVLHPELALPLESAKLRLPEAAAPASIDLIDIHPSDVSSVRPGLSALVDDWTARGVNCRTRVVAGPRFWQSQEISSVPGLADAVADAIDGSR